MNLWPCDQAAWGPSCLSFHGEPYALKAWTQASFKIKLSQVPGMPIDLYQQDPCKPWNTVRRGSLESVHIGRQVDYGLELSSDSRKVGTLEAWFLGNLEKGEIATEKPRKRVSMVPRNQDGWWSLVSGSARHVGQLGIEAPTELVRLGTRSIETDLSWEQEDL